MDADRIFCISCGAQNEPDARFCYKCGTAIRPQQVEPAVVPPPSLSQNSTAAAMPEPAKIEPPAAVPTPEPVHIPPPIRSIPGSDFITLACPSCGGKLEITPSLERFACGHCGNEHIVRRTGGTVALEPVMEKLNQIHENINSMGSGISRITAVSEKQAAEAAIKRINGEIEELKKRMGVQMSNSESSWAFFGISAAVMVMSIMVLVIDGGDTGILNVIFGAGAGLGGLLTVIGLIASLAISSSRKKAEREIDAAIKQKLLELEKNYQIVNS